MFRYVVEAQADSQRQRALALAQHQADRRNVLLALFFQPLFHFRAFVHAAADDEGHQDQQAAHDERQAPAPAHERFLRQLLGQHEDCRRQHEAACHAQLAERREVATPLAADRFADEQPAAAPLAPGGCALQHAQDHHRHGGPEADLLISRQQADQERGRPHQPQRPFQRELAAVAVADVAEDHAAQWARQEAHGKTGERAHRAQQRVGAFGKEQLAEDQRRGRAIDEKVVPLEQRAQGRGHHHLAFLFPAERRRGVYPRHCDIGFHACIPRSFLIDTAVRINYYQT
ncbi:hypothetical protein G6F65_017157 [Rhizopus arrhizus]|nr:hypothetical protein G6F65_017157 [Rhizopus arrhizus]